MNQYDVLLVIKVDFANLGVGLCGRAIGKDGFKICFKPLSQCTIQNHRRQKAQFVPKHISLLSVYVLITVSGQMNQVCFTTLATIKKVEVRFERSW